MEADCVNVLVRKLSRLFETFSSSSKIVVPEEFKLFSENKFPAENVFDIYFGLTPALGINEKTPCIAFFLNISPLLTFTHCEWRWPQIFGPPHTRLIRMINMYQSGASQSIHFFTPVKPVTLPPKTMSSLTCVLSYYIPVSYPRFMQNLGNVGQ